MVEQDFATLAELLDFRATTAPDQVAYTFLQDGITSSEQLAYGELARRARAVAASLQESSSPGDRALLLYPPGLDFVVALFACFETGVIAVPAYPPGRRGNLQIESIFRDARPAVVLTADGIETNLPPSVRQSLSADAARRSRHGDVICIPTPFAGQENRQASGEYALLQYTSGSTSTPKGVMVRHRNLLANSEIIRTSFDLSPSSVSVSWLPAYHDMGLIDGVLQPIYTGFPGYLMPPTAFLNAPNRWLEAISRYRATHSGGPNFAYALCAERTAAADRQGLDLSCWKSAYNGAEPIRSNTLAAFAKAFTPHGFQPHAFYPCYGLAEATLMVTGTGAGSGARVLPLARDELSKTGIARKAEPGEHTIELVSCGHVCGDFQVRIVDSASLFECGPNQVGEIWVSGASITAGYWNLPTETEEIFGSRLADSDDGPYLRTGDLGFLDADELFVTGRLKDLIIIRGRNYYPQDLEQTIDECDSSIRTGCTAVFSIPGPESEQLVVVCELTQDAYTEFDGADIAQAVRRSIRERHGLHVNAVNILPTGRVPKTSSGKIRRQESRSRYLDNTLGELYRGTFASRQTLLFEENPRAREKLLAVAPQERKDWLTAYVMNNLADPKEQPSGESSPYTTLIDQGIDSLAAASLAHRMSSELGLPVSMTDFLENSTVEQVAQRLLDLTVATESVAPQSVEDPGLTGPERPLSPGEQALWFLHKSAPTSPAYNTCYAAKLPDTVDLAVLRGSLISLSERHPVLRTTFPTVDGRPRAVVHDRLPVPVTHDRTELVGVDDQKLEQRIIEFRDLPFDLEHGPLVRAMIVDHNAGQRVLVIAAHHIVVDLWSLRVLVDDLQCSYAGETAQSVTAAWELQDYVHWTAGRISGAEGERLWQYWGQQLAGAPTILALPHDKPRPAVQGFGGASVSMPIEAELLNQLKAFARKSGVTLYTLLLAVYQVLLSRYTGSTDFVLGTPSASRTRPELASLVGYLANQLVLRARLEDNPSFTDHLGRVRDTVLGALAHQEFPFPLLVERLRPQRDPSHTPLFQVMFAFEKAQAALGKELTLEPVAVGASSARFDLTLACVEEDDNLTMRWEYSTDLFNRSTIERLGRHFQSLLTEIIRDPERPIGALRMLTDVEYQRMTLEWNDTAEALNSACLHQLIAAHAATNPEAVAVTLYQAELTYGELDQRARTLAEHLTQLGVGSGSLVAVCMRRSLDLPVALLAVLHTGAAFVPIDPTQPQRRIAHILDDAAAAVVLTQAELRHLWPEQITAVYVDEPLEARLTHFIGAVVEPDELAYVLYTSGSTGAPKGVMVSHRSIVNYLAWANRTYRMTDGAGAPVSSSVTFDATLTSLFGPLLAGKTVALLGEHNEINELRDLLLGEKRQSLFKATPAQLDLLRAVLPEDAKPVNAGALIVGGEAFPPESLEFWRHQSPGMRIFNEYGPTEATVGCCVYEASAHPPNPRNVPIGRPIGNAEMYVLDSNLNIAPVGVIGEIFIGGTGLARGYLNRPELTTQRFIPHPFRAERGARLYQTGDRARYLLDGNIEYLGRIDEQIKIRGIRVELGEIEALLLEHPSVQEAAVTVSGDKSIDRRLTAHVVPLESDGNTLVLELKSFLADLLPSYMLPTTYILTSALPRSPHGKVDRAALQQGAPPNTTEAATSQAVTDLEHVIAQVWREVLGSNETKLDENFFDLGGTSVLAAEIGAKLSNTLAREISLITLFRHPTIGSLARNLVGTPSDTQRNHDAAATDRAQQRAQALQRRKRS